MTRPSPVAALEQEPVRHPVLALGFLHVAGGNQAFGAAAPVGRPPRRPGKGGVRDRRLKKPALGHRMITCQNQHAAGPDQPRQLVENGRLQDTPRRMTVLRPGVGKQHIGAGQRPVGHAAKDQTHIIIPDTDVIDAAILDVAEQAGDTIDERLGTDEARLGTRRGDGGKVLAAAKADFEKQVVGRPVELRRRDAPGSRRSSGRRVSRSCCMVTRSFRPRRLP